MKKSHKYKYGGRVFNWRTAVLSLTIFFCAVLSHYGNKDNVYVAEKTQDVFMKPVVVDNPQDESIETKIRKYFPRSHKTVIAIAYAESGMSMDAVGYNCYYYHGKATTTPIKGGSKACKVSDRHLAWSTDCFVLQDNQPKGVKTCPKDVTVDEHLQEMAELSKTCGLRCWSAYNNGTWKKYYKGNLASN